MVNICFSLLVVKWAENKNNVPRNWGTSKNFEWSEKLTNICHSELFKNQRCPALFQRKSALSSAVSEEISAETALFQRWFWALKISVFSAVQSWISAVQRFSGDEQRWNRPESILNQSWLALNVSETSTRVTIWSGSAVPAMIRMSTKLLDTKDVPENRIHCEGRRNQVYLHQPGSNFYGKTPLFFRYSGVNADNAVNLQAKRR